jgi:hypothetical protein
VSRGSTVGVAVVVGWHRARLFDRNCPVYVRFSDNIGNGESGDPGQEACEKTANQEGTCIHWWVKLNVAAAH